MIVLSILKWILIILASLLGLLLFLLFVILFVPIHYKGNVTKNGESNTCSFVVHWICHIVHASVLYDSNVCVRVRIFGRLIYQIPKREEKKKHTKRKRTSKSDESRAEKSSFDDIDCSDELEKEEFETISERDKTSETDEGVFDQEQQQEDYNLEKEKRTFSSFLSDIFARIDHLRISILTKIKDTIEKIKNLIQKIKNYKAFLTSETMKLWLGDLKKELVYLGKHIRPRKAKGHLCYGHKDPATTGLIFGGISLLYGYLPKKFDLQPNFTEEVFDAQFKLKGHIRLIHILMIAIRIYLNKKTKIIIHDYKSLK